jgi:hypothetical protein
MEDTKGRVSHDGIWKRINIDLAMMRHASEKSKREAWRWGTECDREGQLDVQIWGIMLGMESHIFVSITTHVYSNREWNQGIESNSKKLNQIPFQFKYQI